MILSYFWEDLRSFILAELQNEHLELESFIQIVKKSVVAKAKANLRPRATTQYIDQYYSQRSQPALTTTGKASDPASTQCQLIWVKKPEVGGLETSTAPQRSNNSEISAITR